MGRGIFWKYSDFLVDMKSKEGRLSFINADFYLDLL